MNPGYGTCSKCPNPAHPSLSGRSKLGQFLTEEWPKSYFPTFTLTDTRPYCSPCLVKKVAPTIEKVLDLARLDYAQRPTNPHWCRICLHNLPKDWQAWDQHHIYCPNCIQVIQPALQLAANRPHLSDLDPAILLSLFSFWGGLTLLFMANFHTFSPLPSAFITSLGLAGMVLGAYSFLVLTHKPA